MNIEEIPINHEMETHKPKDEAILDKSKDRFNGIFPGNQNKMNYNWNMPENRK